MSRFTYKDSKGNYQLDNDYVSEKGIDENGLDDITDYVGKLEDLEEDLGFSLEKLSKKEYIYANDYENVLRKYKILGVNFKEKEIWFWDSFVPMHLEFKDYKQYFWFKEDRSE